MDSKEHDSYTTLCEGLLSKKLTAIAIDEHWGEFLTHSDSPQSDSYKTLCEALLSNKLEAIEEHWEIFLTENTPQLRELFSRARKTVSNFAVRKFVDEQVWGYELLLHYDCFTLEDAQEVCNHPDALTHLMKSIVVQIRLARVRKFDDSAKALGYVWALELFKQKAI